MQKNTITNRFTIFGLSLFVCFTLLTGIGNAQTKSKISGVVKDAATQETLMGVNVIIVGTKLGATTDMDGRYNIINVPVGEYSIQATMIGYAKSTVQEVMVSADRIATVDFNMKSNAYTSVDVVVVAEKNQLHKEVSNSQMVVTGEQLSDAAGIREVNSFLEKQPGVSSTNGYLEIRGGSADQTGTMVNGLSFNNATNGNSETSIPLSAISQISLLSGGFNAEYGNFRSGLINVTTKSGDKSKYSATLNVSRNVPHIKRFGPSLSDPMSSQLRPYLDASVAFQGTQSAFKNDPYAAQQYDAFSGWNQSAADYNKAKTGKDLATPLDLYLFDAWMNMAIPDYKGLAKLGYTVSDEQKRLFADHAWKEKGTDYNIDGGFGGPLPFISEELGDATFYLSHNTKEQYYTVPMSRRSQVTSVTMGTVKMTPDAATTITLNGLYKYQIGVSRIRPAFGDFPDATRNGGFMPIENSDYIGVPADGTSYFYDMGIYPVLEEQTLLGGVSVNHVVNKSTYWDLAISYLGIKDHSPNGDNRDNSAITHFGPFVVSEMPYGRLQFASSNTVTGIFGLDTIRFKHLSYDVVPGTGTRRYRSKEGDLFNRIETQQFRLKFDIVSQMTDHHYVKSGIEYNRIDIDHNLYELWNNNATNTYEFNYHRVPSQTGLYLQDQITYDDLVVNMGLRADYFYGGGGRWPNGDPFAVAAFTSPLVDTTVYSFLSGGRSIMWDLWNAYDAAHPGFLQPVKNYLTFSPRLGVAFPITVSSKFYFNYGHFRSNPPYSSMYLLQYRYTKNGLYQLTNPNLEPPKTISYELGVTYNFYDNLILTISGYYKDITGQTNGNVTFQNASSTINYKGWANNTYQDVEGVEVNITKNDNSWITGWINFNYMLKKTGYSGKNLITDLTIGDDKSGLFAANETRALPIPHLNTNISFTTPNDLFKDKYLNAIVSDWRLTIFGDYQAGSYFTWAPSTGTNVVRKDNMRWPDYYMVDMRLSKTFSISGYNTTFYVDIKNVFNIKVNMLNNGNAFLSGGTDMTAYMASLHLPMYNSSEFDALRTQNPGLYVAGNDKPGDLRSASKPYINDPNIDYFIYGNPRDIWFGMKIDL